MTLDCCFAAINWHRTYSRFMTTKQNVGLCQNKWNAMLFVITVRCWVLCVRWNAWALNQDIRKQPVTQKKSKI